MTLGVTIDSNGASAPTYDVILDTLKTKMRGIFGDDIYLENDSKDGQILGVFAAAINDLNSSTIGVFNSYSPTTSQGTGLSRNVKINGISRIESTNSTVDLLLNGIAGTIINNGSVTDGVNQWNLPVEVIIPSSGQIIVTATCGTSGAITASVNTITTIGTPTLGWQSVTNPTAASIGQTEETDPQLKARQKISTALPAKTLISAMRGALAQVAGVADVEVYENDTGVFDSNGLPPHSVCAVVDGGADENIAQVIYTRKTEGCSSYGATSVTAYDEATGYPVVINFYRPTYINIAVTVSLNALTGYVSTMGDDIKSAISDYINNMSIGQDVTAFKLANVAGLLNNAESNSFKVTGIVFGVVGETQAFNDVAIAFNQRAKCLVSDIILNVV